MTDLIEKSICGAVDDGVGVGLKMAIGTLAEARQHVAPENQTWESAIAFLRVVEERWLAESKKSAGEGKT